MTFDDKYGLFLCGDIAVKVHGEQDDMVEALIEVLERNYNGHYTISYGAVNTIHGFVHKIMREKWMYLIVIKSYGENQLAACNEGYFDSRGIIRMDIEAFLEGDEAICEDTGAIDSILDLY